MPKGTPYITQEEKLAYHNRRKEANRAQSQSWRDRNPGYFKRWWAKNRTCYIKSGSATGSVQHLVRSEFGSGGAVRGVA